MDRVNHTSTTPDEHIEINEYLQAIAIYKETLLKLAEVHNNKNGNHQPKQ